MLQYRLAALAVACGVAVAATASGVATASASGAKWRVSDVSQFAIDATAINVDFTVTNASGATATPVCVIDVYLGKKFAGAASLLSLSTVRPGGADISINNRVPVSHHRANQVKARDVQIACASG